MILQTVSWQNTSQKVCRPTCKINEGKNRNAIEHIIFFASRTMGTFAFVSTLIEGKYILGHRCNENKVHMVIMRFIYTVYVHIKMSRYLRFYHYS